MRARLFSMVVLLTSVALAPPAAAQSEEQFVDLSLEELMEINVVEVASRISYDRDAQPVSVTTIDSEQIRLSGARTLNELLMLHVPGFFLVEDQDDTIVGVRGLAPDNNSKLMLLLDGRNVNADWFWGPSDALLNALDLSVIERLEVVRGPGSATQGQGALLGVVNIVTRNSSQAHVLSLTSGSAGRVGGTVNLAFGDAQRHMQLYVSRGEYDGNRYRNEGLSRQIEQGLSVFERNHGLKRAEYANALARVDGENYSVSAFRFDQQRDLYNWRRDREQVREQLTGIHAQLSSPFASGKVSVDGYLHRDDYELRAHGGSTSSNRTVIPGVIMGGQRENRSGLRALWSNADGNARNRLVVGAEFNRFDFGKANFRGNNFIANSQTEVFERGETLLNSDNRWALPAQIDVKSLFFEDFFTLSDSLELFAAGRFDDHPKWGSKLTPRIGALWQANAKNALRLSWQSGFRGAVGVSYSGGFEGDGLLREANFSEIENNGFFRANGNNNLQAVEPEQLKSLELAWRYKAHERFTLNSVGYYNVTENVIGVGAYFLSNDQARALAIAQRTQIGSDRIGDWGGVFYFQNNSGSLAHLGLEVEAEYQHPESGLSVRASQSLVRVQSASAGQFGAGNIYVAGTQQDPKARSFPQEVSRLNARWQPNFADGRLVLMTTWLYYPGWYPPSEGSIRATRASGNGILNLGAAYRLKRIPELSMELQVNNAFAANNLYPATSVAGEGVGNQGVPAVESRGFWLRLAYSF